MQGFRVCISLMGAAVCFALACSSALADDDLPAVRFGEAPLLSPSAAESYYNALPQTHTDGWGSERPVEIAELARALSNDPALIYDYVRNSVDIVPVYGLQKGAMGAIVDHSGTAFDQAHLMVELLRAAGITARYKIGTITLTGAQIEAWLGITSRTALERYLANGGLPASVSGGTTVTSATIGHAWVEAFVNGTWQEYDPSYKEYTWYDGIDLAAAMGYDRAALLTTASTGMQSGTDQGVAYITKVNSTGIASTLDGYASTLLPALRGAHKDKTLEEIAGGKRLIQTAPLSKGESAPAIPYTLSASLTADNIPDIYRTRMDLCASVEVNFVQFSADCLDGAVSSTSDLLKVSVFVDEVYGRALKIDPDLYSKYYNGQNHKVRITAGEKVLGDVDVLSAHNTANWRRKFQLHIVIDHPYAAAESGGASGSYMDSVFGAREVPAVSPGIILHGWGMTSSELQAKFGETDIRAGRYHGQDDGARFYIGNGITEVQPRRQGRTEELTHPKLAASWLAQVDRFVHLLSGARKLHVQHHHSIGVVYSHDFLTTNVPEDTDPNFEAWIIADSKLAIDARSGFSVTSRTDTAAEEKAGRYTLAAATAALEGSVVEQFTDIAETTSTVERFEWANENLSGVRYYEFTPSTTQSTVESLIRYDGFSFANPPQWTGPEAYKVYDFVAAVMNFLNAGQSVIAPRDMHLGPGPSRSSYISPVYAAPGPAGPHWEPREITEPGRWRGPAFIARNAGGTSISHMVISVEGESKGGGSAENDDEDEFDPLKAADILKDEFEDRSVFQGIDLQTGDITYSAPADISVGSGDFPYALSFQRAFKAGETRSAGLDYGWTHNWDIQASPSGSGLEAMGVSAPLNAASTLVIAHVLPDLIMAGDTLENAVFSQMAAHWWLKHLTFNVVTVRQGHSAQQFVRLPDGTFNPPAGTTATLTMSNPNAPSGDGRMLCQTVDGTPGTNRFKWKYEGLGFTLTDGTGNVQEFKQVWHYADDYHTGYLAEATPGDVCNPSDPVRQSPAYVIDEWRFKNGVTLNFEYDTGLWRGTPPGLSRVYNSLGRELNFSYADMTVTGGIGSMTARDYLQSVDDGTGRTAGLSADSRLITAPDGAVTKYVLGKPVANARPSFYDRLLEVYAPSDQSIPVMKLEYDTLWRVKTLKDARAVRAELGR